MAWYADERLERIFKRTNGRCHICWGALAFKNYGNFGERGVGKSSIRTRDLRAVRTGFRISIRRTLRDS